MKTSEKYFSLHTHTPFCRCLVFVFVVVVFIVFCTATVTFEFILMMIPAGPYCIKGLLNIYSFIASTFVLKPYLIKH